MIARAFILLLFMSCAFGRNPIQEIGPDDLDKVRGGEITVQKVVVLNEAGEIAQCSFIIRMKNTEEGIDEVGAYCTILKDGVAIAHVDGQQVDGESIVRITLVNADGNDAVVRFQKYQNLGGNIREASGGYHLNMSRFMAAIQVAPLPENDAAAPVDATP